MAREDYLDEVRLRNALNKQKAMQGASAAAQAAEKNRRERAQLAKMMADLQAGQGAPKIADTQNVPFTVDPSAFANPIQSVPPPAFKLDPRAGEGNPFASGVTGNTGITQSVYGTGIDWDTEAWYIDKNGTMQILPANNPKTGGVWGIGEGDIGRDTGMTDEEFKLAWAQQMALGKKPPSFRQKLGMGTDAPNERQALKLLQDKGLGTGALEPDANRWSQAKQDEAKATDYRTKSFGGERAGDKAEAASQITTTPSAPQAAQVAQISTDPLQSAAQQAAIEDEMMLMEMDTSGTAVQVPQAVQAAAAPVQTSRNQLSDTEWEGGPGQGGTVNKAGGLTNAIVNQNLTEPTQNVPWTAEQWRAEGYELQPDGSWDIPAPAPAPAPAAPAAPAAAAAAAPGPGSGSPAFGTPPAPALAPAPAPAATVPKIADALTVNPAGSQPSGIAPNATWQDVINQREAEAAAVATPAGTPAGMTAGMPAATAVNMAGGQDPWGSMYQASLSPRELWEQYRMQQFGDAPLGAQLAAQENLRYGFEPAMGRFMLGQAAGRITPTAETFTPGEQFGQYIRGGQQADLDEIRRNYQSLGGYLGSLGGGAPAAGTARYAQVFGAPGSEQDLRGNVLQATRAALGTNAFTGGGALGNIYDVMQRQYGAGGAGKFADWVGTAFQPQEQQLQQSANNYQAMQLGTDTLQQNPNWEFSGAF